MTLHVMHRDIPPLPPRQLWSQIIGIVLFLEGQDAQRDGLPRGGNPYQRYGEDSSKAWEAGWDQAEGESPNGDWQKSRLHGER